VIVNAPYTGEQVKSFNSFQRLSDVLSVMKCECNGLLYATEEALVCRECHNTVFSAPLFSVNWAWNRLRKKNVEDDDGEL
jgi:hypothetical protein